MKPTRRSRKKGRRADIARGGHPRVDDAPQADDHDDAPRGNGWATPLALAVVILVGLIAYHNSFEGVFLYDDDHAIVNNHNIRQLWPPGPAMFGPGQGRRPVVGLSLALNYRLGELDPWGYHALNLAVHIAAAGLSFALVRRTLRLPGLDERFGGAATPIALAVALVWMVHPLQTESVTYVVQRAESMMGLALLATLYLAQRGMTSERPIGWYAGAVAVCAAGMGVKESMVVAPVLVAAYDRAFVTRGWAELLRRRWAFYLLLAAPAAALAAWVLWSHVVAGPPSAAAPGAAPIAPPGDLPTWDVYLLTQCEVIGHYVRLAVWPHPLLLSYEWRLARSLDEVLPWAVLWTALLGACVLALVWPQRELPPGGTPAPPETRVRTGLGFLGLWFFIALAPTSSFLPTEDPVFEHRMYVPLAALAALAVIAGFGALRALAALATPVESSRRGATRFVGAVLTLALVATLATATIERNKLYASAKTMWQDVLEKNPDSLTAHNGLGVVLAGEGQLEAATRHFRAALTLNPNNVEALANLGSALGEQGQLDTAIEHLSKAFDRRPTVGAEFIVQNLVNALSLRALELASSPRAEDRDGPRSLELARRACQLTARRDARSLNVLAAAQAETGDFKAAQATAAEALALAREVGDPKAARVAEQLSGLFRQNRPLRQPVRRRP